MSLFDSANLKSIRKGFNRPEEYKGILESLAQHGIYAITSFIFGMDGDHPGVARRTLAHIRTWPPGLPVFGLLTPYPATPLYERLDSAGRLTRPRHWLDFKPFSMDFSPVNISPDQAEAEVREAWSLSYAPSANASAMRWLQSQPLPDRIIHMLSRLAFHGIYFPQTRQRDWVRIIFQNLSSILRLIAQALMVKLRE